MSLLFADFIDKYIQANHEPFLHDLILLIQDDFAIPDDEKNRLLRLSEQLELSSFLAKLYVVIVDSTSNVVGGVKPQADRKRFNLKRDIDRTNNNKTLYRLAKNAVDEQDMASLTNCFSKMTNNLYIAQALISG